MSKILKEASASLLKALGSVYDIRREEEAIAKKRDEPFLMIKNDFKLLE